MGMADDDLEFVVQNSQILTEQQSKFFYASGYSAGSEVANEVMSRSVSYLKRHVESTFDLVKSFDVEYVEHLITNQAFSRNLQKLNETLDYLGFLLIAGNSRSNGFGYDLVETWAWCKNNLVRYLTEYPALYAQVIGCSKFIPSPVMETIRLKEFQGQIINDQQQWLLDLLKESKQLADLAKTFYDKFECVCRNCSSCCGKGCRCDYEHKSQEYLYELGFDECDDPGECGEYHHSQCVGCEPECNCC